MEIQKKKKKIHEIPISFETAFGLSCFVTETLGL